jgi:2',3'-cyclic-nucleotide 2'-phosphodiesterase (5'-nucleotidase family)
MARKLLLTSLGLCALLATGMTAANSADAAQLAVPLDGAKNAVAETNMGDLVADAMRDAVQSDFALIQASALQAVTVPAGDLAAAAMREILVLPDEPIVVLQLDAAHIKDTLERSFALLPYPNKGFLQVSGLKVRFDPKRPVDARVQSIVSATTDASLEPNKMYQVAVPDSLARGTLGYFRVFGGIEVKRTDVTLAQALSQFVAAHSPLSPRVESRLKATQ